MWSLPAPLGDPWERDLSLPCASSVSPLQRCSGTGAQAVQSRTLPSAVLFPTELLRRGNEAGAVGKHAFGANSAEGWFGAVGPALASAVS